MPTDQHCLTDNLRDLSVKCFIFGLKYFKPFSLRFKHLLTTRFTDLKHFWNQACLIVFAIPRCLLA